MPFGIRLFAVQIKPAVGQNVAVDLNFEPVFPGVMFAGGEVPDRLALAQDQPFSGGEGDFPQFENFGRSAARCFDVVDAVVDRELLRQAGGRGQAE